MLQEKRTTTKNKYYFFDIFELTSSGGTRIVDGGGDSFLPNFPTMRGNQLSAATF